VWSDKVNGPSWLKPMALTTCKPNVTSRSSVLNLAVDQLISAWPAGNLADGDTRRISELSVRSIHVDVRTRVRTHPRSISLLSRERQREQRDRRHSMPTVRIDSTAETGLVNSARRPDALNDRQFQRTLRERASLVGSRFLGAFLQRVRAPVIDIDRGPARQHPAQFVRMGD